MMSSTSDNIFLIEEDGECPIEIVNLTPVRKRYRKTSDEDRRRIIQCARTGGDLRTLAENLGINFRTCLSVARTNREYELKRGLPRHKFTEEHKQHLCSVVDLNPEYTLKQIKEQMQKDFDGLSISISSVDRLLDGYGYSKKLLINQPAERNRNDVKEKRHDFADWLEKCGPGILRMYLDETNYNIWCARSFGRSRKGLPCVWSMPSSRGANLNIIACMSNTGILMHECHNRIDWGTFNQFLHQCSRKIHEQQPSTRVVFLFDNAPIHNRAGEAELFPGHSIKWLPPYSPFFNPIEETFSQFKQNVKDWLSENKKKIFQIPEGETIKAHRNRLLISASIHAMDRISAIHCASYDRHIFQFIEPSRNMINL